MRLSLLALPLLAAGCLGPGTLNQSQCAASGPEIVEAQCLGCHSAALTGAQRSGAPLGVNFDTDGDLQRHAATIRELTMVQKTMPPGAPLEDCALQALNEYLSKLEAAGCIPACSGRSCGDDGCGGSCGSCATGETCEDTGSCVAPICTPNCVGRICGDDGCGQSCGACGAGLSCDTVGQCVCVPSCTGKSCGDNGCGGSCGTCNSPQRPYCKVVGTTASCSATCTPSCTGKACGDDGCGGSCGSCGTTQACVNGQCGCAPQCAGKSCGGDGCGGVCGTCSSAATCTAGTCVYPKKTYAADVHPIFGPTCGTAGCHTGGPAEPLDLRTAAAGYQSLVNKVSSCSGKLFVKPNDLTASYLLNKLTGTGMCGGSRMPKGGAALTAAQLDIVRAWISTNADP